VITRMRSRKKRRVTLARNRRGATLVEFAVVAPVMFAFVFGIIEFGRLMMVQQAMTNAAREACREASLATTINSADVDTMARNMMLGVMSNASDPAKVRISMSPASMASVTSGTPMTVDVAVDFSDASWLPGSIVNITSGRVMSAEATFDRE
jgi:Flp pilus assembly protein TadG